jgi:hypothetical protein
MPRHGLHARTAAVIPRPASHGRRVAAFRARASSGRRSLAGAFMRAPRPSLPVQRFGHGTRRGPSRRPAVTYIVLARCRRYQACGAHRVVVSPNAAPPRTGAHPHAAMLSLVAVFFAAAGQERQRGRRGLARQRPSRSASLLHRTARGTVRLSCSRALPTARGVATSRRRGPAEIGAVELDGVVLRRGKCNSCWRHHDERDANHCVCEANMDLPLRNATPCWS